MDDSAEGGVWRPGHGARDSVYDARGLAPQTPERALHARGGGGFGFGTGGAEDRETLDYRAFFRELWRRKFLFIAIATVATALATAIIVRLPSYYVAHALVVIGGPTGIKTSSQDKTIAPPDMGSVQTVVEVLRSPELAAAVIRRLNLEQNPEFNPAAAERAATGVLAEVRGLVSRLKEWCCTSGISSDPHVDAEFSRTVDGFLGHLRVGIKDSSRMIDVAFESKDPQLAMLTANALVDEYIDKELEMYTQSAQRTSDWLRDSIGQLQGKVANAERAVEEFRTENGLFSMPGGSPLVLKQMTDVSAELAEAQTARAAVEARLRQLRKALATAGGRDGTVGDVVDSPVMRALHTEEAEAQQELAELSVKFGEKYPTTVGLKERLRSIHSAMRRENQRVVASLENDLRIARMKEEDLTQRLTALKSDVAQMNGADITLRALERKAEADRRLLDDFIARLNDTASQSTDASSLRTDAQIASYAQLPVSPERPRKKLLVLIAGLASLLGAVLVVHLVEKSDRSLRSLDEVEGHLKVAALGMLPISDAARLSAPEAARYGSTYREALKATYLGLFGTGEAPRVVVVTSAMSGEGKTTLALSLAAMAAQGGQRVLLLDADFWKKGASTALGFRAGAGLAELLEGKIALPDAIISDLVSGADIMLPGNFSRGSLLTWTDGFQELLESLRIRYGVVIIDTPPVLSASESALMARHADATVMAVRWGSTSRDAAAVASRKLHDAGANLAGTVITMVHERQHASYGYMDAAYFSSRFETYQSSPALAITQSTMVEDSGGRTLGDVQSNARSAASHALLVVDMHESAGVSPGRSSPSNLVHHRLTETINGVSDLAARSGMAVIYSHQASARVPKGLSQLRATRSGGSSHAIGSDTSLRAVPEFSFPKRNPDAFSNARLDRFLREKGINHLFIVGLDGATSISETAHSALARGYRVTFIHDGIFTASDDRWRRLLKVFEAAAAFAITRDEFAEFCQRVRLRRGAAA